jgi:hypothetical protein
MIQSETAEVPLWTYFSVHPAQVPSTPVPALSSACPRLNGGVEVDLHRHPSIIETYLANLTPPRTRTTGTRLQAVDRPILSFIPAASHVA